MYILFNSAFKPTYLENVFKFIVCPPSSKIVMRFSERNLNPDISINKNEKCLIVYIDRFNPGQYKYIPIRYGEVISSSQEIYDGKKRIFISVVLGEYVNSTCNFFEGIARDYANSPRLTDSDPENCNDGQYIIDLQKDFVDKLESTKDSWARFSEELSKTKIFREKMIPYYRAEIYDERDLTVQKCKSGNTYKLVLTYYNPKEVVDEIETDFYFPLIRPGVKKFKTGCSMDKIVIPFMVDKVYQFNSWTTISLNENGTGNSIDFDIELEPVYLNKINIVFLVTLALLIFAPFLLSMIDVIPEKRWDNDLLRSLLDLLKWVIGLVLLIRLGKPVS